MAKIVDDLKKKNRLFSKITNRLNFFFKKEHPFHEGVDTVITNTTHDNCVSFCFEYE